MPTRIDPPLALLAELTHRCPLACPYCSNPVNLERAAGELVEQDWRRVLAEAAALGVLQVHFSGGEPMARRDLLGADRRRDGARPLQQPDHLRHAGRRARDRGLRRRRAEACPAELPGFRAGEWRPHRRPQRRACQEDPLRRRRAGRGPAAHAEHGGPSPESRRRARHDRDGAGARAPGASRSPMCSTTPGRWPTAPRCCRAAASSTRRRRSSRRRASG